LNLNLGPNQAEFENILIDTFVENFEIYNFFNCTFSIFNS